MEKVPEQHSFLDAILKEIHENALHKWFVKLQPIEDSLQIILVSYRETTDSIIFWGLYPYNKLKVKLLRNINIRNGEGSVGFTLRSKQPEIVNNTSEDPRGSVAFEDDFIGNKSWFGIPIFQDNKPENGIKFIISFSYNKVDFWNVKDAEKLKKKIKKVLEDYVRELELLNEIKTIKHLQNIFLDGTVDNLTLIERISAVANVTTSYSYIIYKQDNLIKEIKINETLVENRSKHSVNPVLFS